MNQAYSIILFDGVCILCNSIVSFIIRRDRDFKFRFAPLQSPAGSIMLERSGFQPGKIDTIIYIEGEKTYFKSSAVLHILKKLGGGWKLVYGFIFIPPFIRDFIYDIIARTRYRIFGKREACMVPSEDIKQRFLYQDL